MHVEGAHRPAFSVYHEQTIDAGVFHDFQGFGREHTTARSLAVTGHYVADAGTLKIDVVIQAAAQVAIGEDAGQLAIGIYDAEL